ncbi:hypothetical protein FSP39_022737 [Pinctada imbricata]|uniref:Uncharacterized protein n=1 Tax=Pinctada imbricata TaxID=66713 RepID=A0AA89C4Z1_PINIB|nr:hypothetical protein FSP39_022737 [Pinctada imbricata]
MLILMTKKVVLPLQLEKEIDEMQAKFDDIIQRRERENEESRNLEMMLRSDLERINSERDNLHTTNEQLLRLLSDAVKTYMNVEDIINKKLAKVVSTGGADKSPTTPKEERRSPPSVPDSPPGAEGGEIPQETSLLSNLTDEGLDLSQRVSESIFQGPELDTDGEEILSDASNRLQNSVSRLLDMIEDTTSQLHDTKRTQRELVTSVSSGHQESVHMTTKIQDLEERLQEEVEAKEYLAMELHKAEGLIEGYSTERETLEQRIQDLEEKKEALVLDLETTKNKLQDLEQVHHEAASLRSEVQRQQQLMQENAGDEAQGSHRIRPFRYLVVPIGVAIGCYFLRDWVT